MNPFILSPFRAAGTFAAAALALLWGGTLASAQTASKPAAAGEIVVAIRYLVPTGVSHAHLFLYRDDGKLLRQLTNDNTGQDMRPVFAPDGETIVWTREKETKETAVKEYWQIRPRGNGLVRLQTAPAWYKPAQNTKAAGYASPFFTNGEPEGGTQTPLKPGDFPRFRAPDGSVELILREVKGDPNNDIDGPGHGEHFVLHDLKTGRDTELGKLPGFEGVYDLLHNKQAGQRFLLDGDLCVAFWELHQGSTDGDAVFALDLRNPRIVRLGPNWAAPFPLPGEAAFLTRTEIRYVPLAPGSQKTANSTYVERWDSSLHKIRFARPNAASLCYGASLFRPGRTPAVVTVPYFE